MAIRITSSIAILLMGLLTAPSYAIAQPSWEPANEGLTGAALTTIFETRTGALLAGSTAINRYDQATDRWTRTFYVGTYRYATRFVGDGLGGILALTDSIVYRSTDDGFSWSLHTTATSAASAPDGSVVLVGSRGRSTDLGATWLPSSIDRPWLAANLGAGRLIAFSYDSLLVSSDTGRSWRATARIYGWGNPIVVIDSITVLHGSYDGVRRSTDAGVTWELISTLPTWTMTRRGDGVLFAAAFTASLARRTDGVYRSLDSGRTWTHLLQGAVRTLGTTVSGDIWAATHPRVFRSIDDGATWNRSERGLHERFARVSKSGSAFLALASGHVLHEANNFPVAELYRTDDEGRTWTSVLDSIYNVVSIPGRSLLGATTLSQTFDGNLGRLSAHITTNNGASWHKLSSGRIRKLDDNGRSMAIVSIETPAPQSNIRVSTDGGATWDSTRLAGSAQGVTVTPSGRLFASSYTSAADRSIVRSDDSGRTWHTALDRFLALDLVATSNDTVIAFGFYDTLRGSRLYRTTNGGANWSETLFDEGLFEVLHDSVRNLFVVTTTEAHAVYGSSDHGASWTMGAIESTGLLQTGRPRELFAFPSGRMSRSTDLGASWTTYDATGGRTWVSAAANDRVLIGATLDRGLFRTGLSSTVPLHSRQLAACLSVSPVPASDRILVAVEARDRSVFVVNARGERIDRYTVEPGSGSIAIDITGLAEGLYLLEARGEVGVRTGRFIVRR